ncbi:MAG TPA: methylmalonyl-CoA mutase family protein [bacterium]|nr:methylmalonyl-CoA mutase family protein [bacterium]
MDDKPKAPPTTSSGIPIAPLYDRWPDGFDPSRDLGVPGHYPFTRGIYEGMYTRRLWTMRQYAGFGTARESNARYRHLLAQGQTGLSIAFDLPTQMGYDSDHRLARGEVGRTGVAIDGLWDMEVLLDQIPLEQVSISMTINATAAILLALVVAVAKRRGVPLDGLSGTIQNDILKEYIARGTYIYPPKPSMRLIADTIRYCHATLPRWNPISISGYHIREAGSTAAQEIAFTLANGIAYVDNARAAGLEVDDFAPRLSFFLNAHKNLFEEIAKFRCARRLWARIMKERYGARKAESMRFRFHTQTAGSTLTAQQPLVNVPRVTLQALAAVLGGTQSLHTNAYDEALALPTAESAELALRTQQVIAYESGAVETADPLAGSFFIESLTNELETRVTALLDAVDKLGGAVAAVETGYFAREIERSAVDYQRRIESGEMTVVGVNRFVKDETATIAIAQLDPALEREQCARLAAARAGRDAAQVAGALAQLETLARGDGHLMPQIVACVEAQATLGEIADTLRAVWGEYQRAQGG